jgi:hypothetical protein
VLLVDILQELPKAHSASPGATNMHILRFVVKRATSSCCLIVQLIAPPLSMTISHDYARLVVVFDAQFESENTLMCVVGIVPSRLTIYDSHGPCHMEVVQ